MPIFNYSPRKIVIVNEDKSRGINVEFAPEMQLHELKERVREFLDEIEKQLKENEEIEKKKQESKEPDIIEISEEDFNKACDKGTVVQNIGD